MNNTEDVRLIENYDFSGCKVFNTLANIAKLLKRLGYQKYEQIGV